MPEIVFLPNHVSVKVSAGTSIQEAGRSAGLLLDAPCGGHGLCGKCKVKVGKQEVLACQYQVEKDVTVILPEAPKSTGILANGMESEFAVSPVKEGDCHISVDIGTTTVVVYLLDGKSGRILGSGEHAESTVSLWCGCDIQNPGGRKWRVGCTVPQDSAGN